MGNQGFIFGILIVFNISVILCNDSQSENMETFTYNVIRSYPEKNSNFRPRDDLEANKLSTELSGHERKSDDNMHLSELRNIPHIDRNNLEDIANAEFQEKLQNILHIDRNNLDDIANTEFQERLQNSYIDEKKLEELTKYMESQETFPDIDPKLVEIDTLELNLKSYEFDSSKIELKPIEFGMPRNDDSFELLGLAIGVRIASYVGIVLLVLGIVTCIKFFCPNRCKKKKQGFSRLENVDWTKSEKEQLQTV